MPYISSQQVSEIRTQIKKQFPEFRFSITRSHYNGISIIATSGPLQFGGGGDEVYTPINHYHIYPADFQAEEFQFLNKLTAIAEGKLDECGPSHVDCDYGTIPPYYIRISIGRWDKKYIPKK